MTNSYDVYDIAHRYGLQAADRATMPQFAFAMAGQALEGKISPDDAEDIYMAYVSRGKIKASPTAHSFRAQASKLRQILKCVEEHGEGALTTLCRVAKMHDKLNWAKNELKPTYHAMVDACRLHLWIEAEPTDAQLVALLKRRTRKSKVSRNGDDAGRAALA